MTTPPTGIDDTQAPDAGASPEDSAPHAVHPDPVTPTRRGDGLAIAAFVVGIAAFLLGWVAVLGIILGLVALMLAVIALVTRRSKVFSIIGLVLGALGLVTSILMTAVGLWAVANYDTIASALVGSEVVQESAAPVAPVVPDASATGEPAPPAPVDPASFVEDSDETFGAIVADPNAHGGRKLVVYGEVAQFDETTGACAMILSADNSLQTSWEGYAQPVVMVAVSGETACPEFAGVAQSAHVKVWASVDSKYTLEYDDGPRDVPGFLVHQVEVLDPLP